MELIIIQKPVVAFSGMPMWCKLAINPYNRINKAQNYYVVMDILVEATANTNVYNSIKTQKLFADDNGLISLDISSIVDAYLSYFVPPVELDSIISVPDQIRNFTVNFKLYKDEVSIDDDTFNFTALKGGYGKEHYPLEVNPGGSNNIFDNFLFISTGTDRVSADDIFFANFATTSDGQFFIKVFVKGVAAGTPFNVLVYESPKLQATVSRRMYCIPFGYKQLKLDTLLAAINAAAEPEMYIVEMWLYNPDEDESTKVAGPIYFNLEQRNFYDTKQLLYRNSLGSLVPLRLLGQIDYENNYILEDVRTVAAPSYLEIGNILPKIQQNFVEEEAKFKGNTGFLTKYESQRLRDFFLSKQRFEVKDGRLLPIIINNKSVGFASNKDNLINLVIEWQHAFSNQYYSDVQLADAACPAVSNFTCRQTADNEITVYWLLPFGFNKALVNINFPGEDTQEFTITGNSGIQKLNFERPDSADETITLPITAKVICNPYNAEPSYGAAFETSVELLTEILPIAVDDIFSLSSGYTDAVALSGSVLDNDYETNELPIEVVPNTGATTEGGTFEIDIDGKIEYTPPSPSFSGADSFVYEMKRTGGATTVEGTVVINVNNVPVYTFAKIVLRDQYSTGGSNNLKKYATVWIDFFSDPACQFPKSVSALSVNMNYNKKLLIGGVVDEDYYTTFTSVATGTKIQIYSGRIYRKYFNLFAFYEEILTFNILSGTGYTPL